jgi:tRNA dimethylallyltransferase
MTSSSDASVVEQVLRIVCSHPGELLAVVGPTASGKTALAVQIAERAGGEVISADSVQIYRGFDIGSGKPTAQEMARAPHHLVGAIDPLDAMDAATWAHRASEAVAQIRARGRVPIVCGGTFLWVKALVFGLAPAPGARAEIRARHQAIAAEEGRSALHARLRDVDAETAKRLHPNDFVRVSRALEVHELSGKPMSAWQREHAFASARHPTRLVTIDCPPPLLTARIEARVRAWLAAGWVEEVEALTTRGYDRARAMSSVGYAQVRAMLAGRLARADLAGAIVRATRVFARRQRTWLRHADITWLGDPEALSPPPG